MKWETTPAAFPAAELELMATAIRTSPFVDENPLNYRFSDTRGFSIVVRESGMETLMRHFPDFAPFLRRVIHPRANAWYLNPLLVGSGASIGRHRDLSLRTYSRPFEPPPPLQVDVLYLDIPPTMQGGELILYGRNTNAWIAPQANLLVTFDGRMLHEVNAVTQADGERMSLVLEQYRLSWWYKRRIPLFRIESSVPFTQFLDDALDDEDVNCVE